MKRLTGKNKLLRIFIGEKDSHDGLPLYKAITNICYYNEIAGVTVFRGIYGYGANSIIHSSRTIAMSSDLPIVVEIVDTPEKIDCVLPDIEKIMQGGMITVELADVIRYENK